eukprot:TRINITY_DN1370_c0_g1_i3.p2 TRINITY_DN1370_c0_g1~~TRINITY_DN1370_c0_g1_i3.p2  ORF type:complete len:128 (-),score=9.19 TRINITY_DN1370_c0_g1_i3:594-977(-)
MTSTSRRCDNAQKVEGTEMQRMQQNQCRGRAQGPHATSAEANRSFTAHFLERKTYVLSLLDASILLVRVVIIKFVLTAPVALTVTALSGSIIARVGAVTIQSVVLVLCATSGVSIVTVVSVVMILLS